MLEFFAKTSSEKVFLILLYLHAVASIQLGAKNKQEKSISLGLFQRTNIKQG